MLDARLHARGSIFRRAWQSLISKASGRHDLALNDRLTFSAVHLRQRVEFYAFDDRALAEEIGRAAFYRSSRKFFSVIAVFIINFMIGIPPNESRRHCENITKTRVDDLYRWYLKLRGSIRDECEGWGAPATQSRAFSQSRDPDTKNNVIPKLPYPQIFFYFRLDICIDKISDFNVEASTWASYVHLYPANLRCGPS